MTSFELFFFLWRCWVILWQLKFIYWGRLNIVQLHKGSYDALWFHIEMNVDSDVALATLSLLEVRDSGFTLFFDGLWLELLVFHLLKEVF